VARVLKEK
jgi:hypothetical protein